MMDYLGYYLLIFLLDLINTLLLPKATLSLIATDTFTDSKPQESTTQERVTKQSTSQVEVDRPVQFLKHFDQSEKPSKTKAASISERFAPKNLVS